MKIVDITYQPQIVKTNGKNPFILDGITFYPDTIQEYNGGYILPIIKLNKQVGNIFESITSGISSAGKWVTGATSNVADFLKTSGLVEIATDVTGLITAYNNITGQNKTTYDYTPQQQKEMQQIINTKTNTTGTYTNSELNQLANLLAGNSNSNDINKYLPYIAIGGMFLILLVLLVRR